ncbi:MAG: hypothetical protein U1D30_19685 [Planctomycetota bacterium]
MATYRVVTKNENGGVQHRDYTSLESLLADFEQIGIEEDSYTMRLHGEPVFKGLIGPMSDGKSIIRYETPEVFAMLTEQWSKNLKNGKLPKGSS